MSRVAAALLSVTASEAAVERTFSYQDAIHTKKRNRMINDTIIAEHFIHFNYHLLATTNMSSSFKHNACCVELQNEPLQIDSDIESDVDIELDEHDSSQSESEQEQKQEQLITSESSSSSASVPLPRPSYSMVLDNTRNFLVKYIDLHGIDEAYTWTRDRENALEAAALNESCSVATTKQMKADIKCILQARKRSMQ